MSKYKAVCGCGYIFNNDFSHMKKTKNGWESWAKKEAERMSKRDRFTWTPSVAWIDFRNAFRISFGGMPFNISTGK